MKTFAVTRPKAKGSGAVTRYCSGGQDMPVFTYTGTKSSREIRRLVAERWRQHRISALALVQA